MKKIELGTIDLSDTTEEKQISIAGKLVIEEASELAFLVVENAELQEDPSQIKGDKIEVISPELLDKIFDNIPPLVGGIYAYALKATINGKLNNEGNALFTYQLTNTSQIELYRDNGDKYHYNL